MTERQVLDALPVGVAVLALDGELLHVNPCLAGWLASTPQALIGRTIDQCLTRAGRVLYHTHLLPTLRLHGQLQELVLTLEVAGVGLPVLVCAAMTEGTGTEASRVQLVMSPMRERLRVEAELQRARRAADAAPVLLFEYQLDPQGLGSFAYVSAGLQRLYGHPAVGAHLPESVVWGCVHPDDLPGVMAARELSARSGQVWGGSFRVRAAGREDWVLHDILAQPEPQADGSVTWRGTIADITRQQEIEQAARLRDAAQRANQAKSEFLARMSHELRTPLNGIIGFAQLLASDERQPPTADQRRKLAVIDASGHRLLSLINEVLDIARIEAGRLQVDLQPVRLLPLLQQAVAAIEPMSGAAGLSVSLQCSFDDTAMADGPRLGQVLSNLLSNAVKYNRSQGGVAVSVRASAEHVRIDVRDTGQGLSPEQLLQLFQPFNRLGAERSDTEGTGLGLVIARSLVEAMGGWMDVDSQPGQGSCFSVHLPRAELTAPPPSPELACPRPTLLGSRRRVLYVEDNPVNALLMEQVLSTLAELSLRIVPDGASALASLSVEPADLLLLDMHLGDMNGLELLQRLRALPGQGDVPAVVVSADAMPDDVARALAGGFQAYWTKPIDVHRLRAEVVRLLNQGQPAPAPQGGGRRRG